ncbi:MAG: OPT family oligopeptide transporter, partial [Phycisphaerae bacterium]|nr:OPT family oligopeptide transporter [Phycisphaerae bacterium]
MALPQLNDEQVRTMSREEKDRWWLENVFRGNMPQLTLRAGLTGFLLGGVLSATNLYVGAKTGWTLGVGVTSVILSFVIFRTFARIGFKDLTILENNAVQSIATAAGYMTGPLISALMAYMFIENKAMPAFQMMVWNILASILGVLVAFPMKRRFINDEQQPFPEGRAAAVVMDSLYPDAPPGGTKNMVDGMPVERPASAADSEGTRAGMFKAKALAIAAGLAALIHSMVATGIMGLVQIKSGIARHMGEVWHLPEHLTTTFFAWMAARGSDIMPRLGGIPAEQLGLRLGLELTMFGAGGLMGMRLTNSLMVGMALGFGVLAPVMIGAGEINPKNYKAIVDAAGAFDPSKAIYDERHIMNNWTLWLGVSMMVTASMVGLFAKPKMLISAFTGMFSKRAAGNDCLREVEFPLWITLVGVPVMVGITVWMNWAWFGVDPWLGLLSIPLIIILTLIAANATALTSITPTGSLSKITQFTFGAANPTHAGTNLITAGMTTEVASNASNLLMDIKPGYMLGAKPRQQAWGHIIGIVAGALASTPLFFILFLSKWNPESGQTLREAATEKFAMIGAVQWSAIAEVIRGMASEGETIQRVQGIDKLWGVMPVSAAWGMMWGAIAALVIEVLRIVTKNKFPLSGVGIGLGIVLPPEYTIMMWIGSAFFAFMEGRYHERLGTFGYKLWVDGKEAVCAGIIAGWALLGVFNGVVEAFATLPANQEQAAAMEAAAEKEAQSERDTILGPDGAPV